MHSLAEQEAYEKAEQAYGDYLLIRDECRREYECEELEQDTGGERL
jgi:hypothetical protein